jgi:Protein of unknown function (DUF2510)
MFMTASPGWYPDPAGARDQQRYFDGHDWSPLWRPMPQPLSLDPLSIEERSDRLDLAVADAVRRGGRVESRSATQAVIVYGKAPSGGVHVIHFLLTLLTFGFWLLVWILYAMSRHEDRVTVAIDSHGNLVVNGKRRAVDW